jgi:hypothetical protein
MGTVADPIHEAEDGMIEGVFGEMVLDQDEARGDAASLEQERERIEGVVQNVDEEADIERGVREWKMLAVEGQALDGTVGAGSGFYALDMQVRHSLGQKRGEGAIAGAYVEQTRASGQKGSQALGESSQATAVHDIAVDAAEKPKKGCGHVTIREELEQSCAR